MTTHTSPHRMFTLLTAASAFHVGAVAWPRPAHGQSGLGSAGSDVPNGRWSRRAAVLAAFLVLAAGLPATAGAHGPAAASRVSQRTRPAHRGRTGAPPRLRAVRAARVLLRPLAHLMGVKVIGAEHLRGIRGSVVVAANHVAYLDPIVLTVASPKPVRFMGKAELFDRPILGAILRRFGAFPVERPGRVDYDEINRESRAALEGDHALGIFSEGTMAWKTEAGVAAARAVVDGELADLRRASSARARRRIKKLESKRDHKLRPSVLFGGPSKSGAARQAVWNDRPVVPAIILGTSRLETAPIRLAKRLVGKRDARVMPPGRGIIVVFGKPIYPRVELGEKERIEALQAGIEDAQRRLARPYLHPRQQEIR